MRVLRVAVPLILALAVTFAVTRVHADEPLWTEGRGSVKANAGVGTRVDFVRLAESLGPAVVYIAGRVGGSAPRTVARRFESDPTSGKSVGTGFLINKNGYLLTNYHVIEKTEDIRVKLADGRDFYAQVVGVDEKTDVALLKIDVPQPL